MRYTQWGWEELKWVLTRVLLSTQIKDLCQHTAGVAWLDEERIPTTSELSELDALATKIAGQPHNFGGEYHKCYHAITQGWVRQQSMIVCNTLATIPRNSPLKTF